MQGKLELNLDPAFIGFASPKHKRLFRYCRVDEVMSLLVDLKLLSITQRKPLSECIVSIIGDFPAEVLAKHGLIRHYEHERQRAI